MNRRSPLPPSVGPARIRHILTCTAVVWAALWAPAPAQAAAAAPPAPSHADLKVLLLTERPSDPFIERIRAEVAALGLNVVIRAPVGPLESDAREQHAAAAIRMLPSRKGVEVWMADATTGRTLARQLVVDERPPAPDQSLVALQTAEILRTGLLTPRPHPSTPPPPAQPPVIIVNAPPRNSRSGVQAGLGPLYSSGGSGTALQAWLSIENRWRKGFGVALDLSLPLLPGSLAGPEGSADVGTYCGGLEVFAVFPPGDPHWFVTTGVGGGVALVRMVGAAKGALIGEKANATVGHGFARVSAGWKPTPWATLAASALAGTSFESVTLRFAGNDAGSWGGIVLAAFVHAGVDWD